MHIYPKMHLPYDKFVRQLPRLQNYLAIPKYWRDNNKNGQRKEFLENFSLQKWESLSNNEKLDHRIHDCPPCEHSKLLYYSVLHKSVTESTKNLIHLSNEIVNELDNKNNIGVNKIL